VLKTREIYWSTFGLTMGVVSTFGVAIPTQDNDLALLLHTRRNSYNTTVYKTLFMERTRQSMSGDLTLLADDVADLDVLLTTCRQDVLRTLIRENPAYSQKLYQTRLKNQRARVAIAFTMQVHTKNRATFAQLFRDFAHFVAENSFLCDRMEDMNVPQAMEIYCITELIDEMVNEFDEITGQENEQRIFLKYLTGDATRFEIAAMLNTMSLIYERARRVVAFSSRYPECRENIARAQLEIQKLRPRFMLPGETDPDDEGTAYSHATNVRRTQFISQQIAYEQYDPEDFRVLLHQFLVQYPGVLQRHRDQEAQVAFSMVSHDRLGASSRVSILENNLIAMIARLVFDCTSAPTDDTTFTRNLPRIPRILSNTAPHSPDFSYTPPLPTIPPFPPAQHVPFGVAAGGESEGSDSD